MYFIRNVVWAHSFRQPRRKACFPNTEGEQSLLPFTRVALTIYSVQIQNITSEKYVIPFGPLPDATAIDLLRRCLQRDPSKRPGIPGAFLCHFVM